MTPENQVALVYPPFGPVGLPSLGLGLLSAALKQRGIGCKTYFWNFHFLKSLPYCPEIRLQLYRVLGERSLHPWNEWPFACWLYPEVKAKAGEHACELDALSSQASYQSLGAPIAEVIGWIMRNCDDLLTRPALDLARFKVVGINSTFYQQLPALSLAKRIKQINPRVFVVLGGANCDDEMGDAHLEASEWLDAVLKGEADTSFPNLVEAVLRNEAESLAEIPGLVYRCGSHILRGPDSIPFNSLNDSPLPDYDDYVSEHRECLELPEETLCLPLESSRGCWWGAKRHCTFCGLNANGMVFRKKDFETFVSEVKSIHGKYGNSMFFMADNILDRSFYDKLCDCAAADGLQVEMFFEIKSNASRDDVKKLAAGGVTLVQPGIESFSSSLLRLMRKGVRGIDNVAFLKFARDYGITPAYNLLYAFPGEAEHDYVEMLRQFPALEHLQPPASCFRIEFHRFSPYHQNPEAFGISLHAADSYRKLYPFGEEFLGRIAYVFEQPQEQELPATYASDLKRACKDWKERFSSTPVNLRFGDSRIGCSVVHDSRSVFGYRKYVLRDYASQLLLAVDKPRVIGSLIQDCGGRPGGLSLNELLDTEYVTRDTASEGTLPSRGVFSSLVEQAGAVFTEEVEIEFSAEDFLKSPIACLSRLFSHGLIYCDEDRVVSLVNAKDPLMRSRTWNRLRL